MRILLDQAVYDQRNKGNVALLQTAIKRLSEFWPDARIDVLTEAPFLLKLYCPNVHPVSVHSWQNYSQGNNRFVRYSQFIPRSLLHLMVEIREEIWHRYPDVWSQGWGKSIRKILKLGNKQREESSLKESDQTVTYEGENDSTSVSQDFLQAIRAADLVVATGGGYLCDADKQYTLQVFDTLELAIQLGKPAAMVGQGVGPLKDPGLRRRLSKLLPSVDLILIREPKIAIPFLLSLGVSPENVIMTGDDAIEMAYNERSSRWRNHIGISLRIAGYTEVEKNYITKLRQVVQEAASKYKSPLMALPTSSNLKEEDFKVIQQILRGYKPVSVDRQRFDSPLRMIRKIGKCRVVVTGTYHPAVFALAQGIPAIGLVKSKTYIDKFSALQDEFGSGCQMIYLDDENFNDKLITAIDSAWESAEQVRAELLEAAVRQAEWGRAGYRRLYELVTERN